MFFLLFFSIFNLFFIFGCAGSSLLSVQTFSIARLLIAVTFLVVEHRLEGLRTSVVGAQGLSGCSSWALEHRLHGCGPRVLLQLGMCNLPRLGVKPMPPALAGRFLTTGAPEKSLLILKSAQCEAEKRREGKGS